MKPESGQLLPSGRALAIAALATALLVGCAGKAPSVESPSGSVGSSPSPAGKSDAPDATQTAVVARRASRANRKVAVEAAVRRYYRELNDRDFEAAWRDLTAPVQDRLGGFSAWKAGYATTRSTEIVRGSARSATPKAAIVDLALRSRDNDACGDTIAQRFEGSWRLGHRDGHWVATAIELEKVAGDTPVSDESDCAVETERGKTSTANAGPALRRASDRVCLAGVRLPTIHLPTTRIPAVTLPAYTDYAGVRHPARRIAGRTIPGSTIPGSTIPARCFDVPRAFAPQRTTILTSGYDVLDDDYSGSLTGRYWSSAGRASLIPDYSAPGFGEANAAGFPKNQYVRSYVRRDGTFVHSYWRNSPTDGLPTCRVISC